MSLIAYFKSLSDETRLRMFNLLMHHELNVNEIVMAMGMGQSRISRHLKILTDSGLLSSRRDGLWVFYRAAENGKGRAFIDALGYFLETDEELVADLAALRNMIQERSFEKTSFFNAIAPDWDDIKSEILGDMDVVSILGTMVKKGDVAADLGCGTGDLLLALHEQGARVMGVDKSPMMLDITRKRFAEKGINADLRIGELEHLPMRDGEADLAVINMVLHYLPSPRHVIAETARVLNTASKLVIIDLEKHTNEEMRRKYEHRWLGFDRDEMTRWLTEGGFALEDVKNFSAKQGMIVNIFVAKKGK